MKVNKKKLQTTAFQCSQHSMNNKSRVQSQSLAVYINGFQMFVIEVYRFIHKVGKLVL